MTSYHSIRSTPDVASPRRRRRLVALALALAPWVALGQTPDTPTQESDRPPVLVNEEIGVNLVQLPILALDRKGNPVTDLRIDELVVKDRGQPVDVASLDPFYEPPTAEEPLPDVRLRVDLPGGGEPVLTASPGEPRHMMFYIDVENDATLRKAQAVEDLIRFVTEELDPSYQAAVLSYNGSVTVNQPFTRDRIAVAQAIRDAFNQRRRPQIDLRARIYQLIDRLQDCVTERGDFRSSGSQSCVRAVGIEYADEVRPRSRDFLVGLEAIVKYAAGLEGRKSVVAFSHGAAINPSREVTEAAKAVFGDGMFLADVQLDLMSGEGTRILMDDVMDMAIRNQVTLHFVDRMPEPSGVTSARQGTPLSPGAMPVRVAYAAPQQDLQEIATTTGGVFIATTEVFEGAKEAVDKERGGYYVGYYTDGFLPKDRRSKFSISSTRKGVRILHSRGTYSRSQRPGQDSFIKGQFLLGKPEAARSASGPQLKIPFQLTVEPKGIGYERLKESAVSNFTLHVKLKDETGRAVADSYHFVNHSYPWDLWLDERVEPLQIPGSVQLPPGEYVLEASFNNPKLGYSGSITRELRLGSRTEEPPPSEEEPR